MFTPREQMAEQAVPACAAVFARRAPAAAFPARPRLSLVPPAPEPPTCESVQHDPAAVHPALVRWHGLCRRIEHWWHVRDLVPDLAEDIGSARWLRGFGTMLALSGAALAFWPDFSAVAASPLDPVDETARGELRTYGIAPLGSGARSGRRHDATEAVVPLAAAPERPTLQLTAIYGEGDSLPRMLQRAGVGLADAQQVASAVEAAAPGGALAPGTRFDIMLGQRAAPAAPRPLQAVQFRPRFDLALAVRRQGAGFAVERRAIPVDTSPLRLRGIVGSSLYRSARAAGAPATTVQDYLRAIDQFLPFEDISPSDEFDLVVSYKRTGDGLGQPGELLYAGIVRDGKPRVQLLRWGQSGAFQSAEAIAGPARADDAGLLGAPVAGHITSGFGARRHPILGFVRMHAGIDFAAGWGTPVHAVTDGTVTFAGWHGGHGNYVRIDHGGGVGSGYAHMSRLAASPGMRVQRGQVIGYVGSTGLSTGPHLHYELYRGGRPVDPSSLRFIARQAPVDPGQQAAFQARLRQLLATPAGFTR